MFPFSFFPLVIIIIYQRDNFDVRMSEIKFKERKKEKKYNNLLPSFRRKQRKINWISFLSNCGMKYFINVKVLEQKICFKRVFFRQQKITKLLQKHIDRSNRKTKIKF